MEAGRPGRHRADPRPVGQQVPMRHEVVGIVAAEHHDRQRGRRFDAVDERAELIDGVRVEKVHRAIVKVTRQYDGDISSTWNCSEPAVVTTASSATSTSGSSSRCGPGSTVAARGGRSRPWNTLAGALVEGRPSAAPPRTVNR